MNDRNWNLFDKLVVYLGEDTLALNLCKYMSVGDMNEALDYIATCFLESLYIKKVSKERYYKVDVRKRTNSPGFEVIVDFNMTCPVIDGNESIDF